MADFDIGTYSAIRAIAERARPLANHLKSFRAGAQVIRVRPAELKRIIGAPEIAQKAGFHVMGERVTFEGFNVQST
jgi:hypothetical protein